MTKKFYIHTIGCQMNVYDSEQIARSLESVGYRMTSSVKAADMILVNTCAIREKAEQKVFSFLGRLGDMKKVRPELIIAVGGCVAQQEGRKILERAPYIDLVFGTHAVSRVPEMIKRIESESCRIVDVEVSEIISEIEFPADDRKQEKSGTFVTIMQGCDNYCTYCVVPYVRGREMSRNPENIIREIRNLVATGVREITLLGQNVNSYGIKEELCSFPELLAQIAEIEGLLRIRFTTSHPKDLSENLMLAFKNLDKLCRHIHLPVQSGSNRILKKMNRKYTREQYLERIEKLRGICPDIAMTSDMIVGFPGETRADFEETLNLMKTVEYDGLFAFQYSDRPNAAAARFPEKISEKEKRERLLELLELQEYFTLKKNKAMIGSVQEILVDGMSKRGAGSRRQGTGSRGQGESVNENDVPNKNDVQWMGRTSGNKVVNFTQSDECDTDTLFVGKVIPVRIEEAFSHSLRGKPLTITELSGLKGDKT